MLLLLLCLGLTRQHATHVSSPAPPQLPRSLRVFTIRGLMPSCNGGILSQTGVRGMFGDSKVEVQAAMAFDDAGPANAASVPLSLVRRCPVPQYCTYLLQRLPPPRVWSAQSMGVHGCAKCVWRAL